MVGAYFYMVCLVIDLQLWEVGLLIQHVWFGFLILVGLVLSGCGCGVVWALSYKREMLQTNKPILEPFFNFQLILFLKKEFG